MDKNYKIKLANGVEMPIIGLGVYQVESNETCEDSVAWALEAGYRMIDTAQIYGNEKSVAKGIKKSGVSREEIFITTKIWVSSFGYEATRKAIKQRLEFLGVDYIDLLLLHAPLEDFVGAWKALEEAYNEGILKSIGVSNFYHEDLVEVMEKGTIKPMVNQLELHPLYQRADEVKFMKENGIVVESWGSLVQGQRDIHNNPVIKTIADKYHKTNAQVILRWLIQQDIIIIPKSVHQNRIEQNINLFDFELATEDIKQIETLDEGAPIGWDVKGKFSN